MMALPRESITKGLNILPKGANSSEATLAEPLGCCINAQDLAGVSRDDFVLIIGGGPTGILHALLARQRGQRKLFYPRSWRPGVSWQREQRIES